MKTRDYFIDNLKGLLIFLVVFCHGLEQVTDSSDFNLTIHKLILCFVMPSFVFVTGYFAKSMAIENNPKRIRIYNFILLYIIMQAVKRYILGGSSFLKPAYANWFIWACIVWYTILPLATKLKPVYGMVSTVLAGLLCGLDPTVSSTLQISRVICFFPYFLLGYYISPEIFKHIENLTARKYEFGILIASIILCLLWTQDTPYGILHANKSFEQMDYSFWEGIIKRFSWYILTILCFVGLAAIVPRRENRLSFLGTRTLTIYVFHTIFYAILLQTIFFNSISSYYGTLLYITALSICVTFIFGSRFFQGLLDILMKYDLRHLIIP